MPINAFFLRTRDLLVSQKMMQRHFFSTLHPLSTVIFVTATVLAFVLLRDSRFNFHCYTQREATPTQKSARKCAVTSRNFLHERLQSAFTLANQLRQIAQYKCKCVNTKGRAAINYPSIKMITVSNFLYILCQSAKMIIETVWTDLNVIPDHLTSISDVLLQCSCMSQHLFSKSFLHAVMMLQETVDV